MSKNGRVTFKELEQDKFGVFGGGFLGCCLWKRGQKKEGASSCAGGRGKFGRNDWWGGGGGGGVGFKGPATSAWKSTKRATRAGQRATSGGQEKNIPGWLGGGGLEWKRSVRVGGCAQTKKGFN